MSEALNFDEQPILVPQEEILAPQEEVVLEEAIIEAPVEEVAKPVVEKKPAKVSKTKSNEHKVVKIVQQLPSTYRLLVEGKGIVKVPKTKYKLGQKTIKF